MKNKGRKEIFCVVGNFTPHANFVQPEQYGPIVRDNVVRTCVDVLVMTKEGEVLLGMRNIDPWPSFWSFGGAMKPGERPSETAVRLLIRDIGLEFPVERFIKIDDCDSVFDRRREPIQEHGCHDHNLFYLIVVDKQEILTAFPEKDEYDEFKWLPNKAITMENGFHPNIVEMVKEAILIIDNIEE